MYADHDTEPVDLQQFDDSYEPPAADEGDFQEPPDGDYDAVIESVELTRAKFSGKPMLKWTLQIDGPKHVGRKLFRNNMLVTAENVQWAAKDLRKVGLELRKPSDLQKDGFLDLLEGIRVAVRKVTRGDFYSTYINEVLPSREDAGIEPPSNDCPF